MRIANMTPTEQDKELREAICNAMNIHPEELKYSLPNSFGESELEAIMQLITADRKRVALEARIDSLLAVKRRIYETDAFELGLALGIIDSELKNLGWTPGELKTQQEEL